jgi:hypothetical protein
MPLIQKLLKAKVVMKKNGSVGFNPKFCEMIYFYSAISEEGKINVDSWRIVLATWNLSLIFLSDCEVLETIELLSYAICNNGIFGY